MGKFIDCHMLPPQKDNIPRVRLRWKVKKFSLFLTEDMLKAEIQDLLECYKQLKEKNGKAV